MNKCERMRNMKKWLKKADRKNLVATYCRRFAVSEITATDELAALGYWDNIQIQRYDKNGIEWEFQYDGYSDDMKVVPKGTPEEDFYFF